MKKNKMLLVTVLILFGILSRTLFHIGDNIEFVTSAALLSGAYIGLRGAIIVPFIILFITDLIIGNTNIFLFTWSAYILIGVVGYILQKSRIKNLKFRILRATGLGLIASIWFYLWTNFGVWLFDNWGMYPKTITGLLDAYILGLPFLKNNFIGNLVLVPSSFLAVESVCVFIRKYKYFLFPKRNLRKL